MTTPQHQEHKEVRQSKEEIRKRKSVGIRGRSPRVQVRVQSTGQSGKKGILCVLGLRKGKKAEQAGKKEQNRSVLGKLQVYLR